MEGKEAQEREIERLAEVRAKRWVNGELNFGVPVAVTLIVGVLG